MAQKKSILAMTMDFVSEKGEVLHKLLEGDVLNNTKNALAAFVFKDHEGNAVFPTLNPDGTIPTSSQSGKPFAEHKIFLVASQVKDVATKAVFKDLEVDGDEIVRYTKPDFKMTSYSEARARLELVVDEGEVSESIILLGFGAVADVFINDKQRIVNNFADVPAGALTAQLRLMVTAYEDGPQADDIDCSISINKLPVQTP